VLRPPRYCHLLTCLGTSRNRYRAIPGHWLSRERGGLTLASSGEGVGTGCGQPCACRRRKGPRPAALRWGTARAAPFTCAWADAQLRRLTFARGRRTWSGSAWTRCRTTRRSCARTWRPSPRRPSARWPTARPPRPRLRRPPSPRSCRRGTVRPGPRCATGALTWRGAARQALRRTSAAARVAATGRHTDLTHRCAPPLRCAAPLLQRWRRPDGERRGCALAGDGGPRGGAPGHDDDADLALALQLQEEENERARQARPCRPTLSSLLSAVPCPRSCRPHSGWAFAARLCAWHGAPPLLSR